MNFISIIDQRGFETTRQDITISLIFPCIYEFSCALWFSVSILYVIVLTFKIWYLILCYWFSEEVFFGIRMLYFPLQELVVVKLRLNRIVPEPNALNCRWFHALYLCICHSFTVTATSTEEERDCERRSRSRWMLDLPRLWIHVSSDSFIQQYHNIFISSRYSALLQVTTYQSREAEKYVSVKHENSISSSTSNISLFQFYFN